MLYDKKIIELKKVLSGIIFWISISAGAQTSVYHPFPDSNAVWNFNYGWIWGCGPPLYNFLYESYSCVMNGDTTISSQQYHKLYIPFVESNCSGAPASHATGYMGCVRQDTILRKVFFVYPNSTVDSLLYDFTLQVGDTVKGVIECCAATTDTVQSIDSVLVGNYYRKRWNINFGYNIYLIEGIGSTFGLIERSPGNITDGPGYTLSCFTQNGFTLYPDTTTICNLITGMINISDENIFLNLSPNPATTQLAIGNGQRTIKEIEIYDVLGRKRLTLNSSLKGNELTASIDVSGFSAAIYFVRVRGESTLAVGKYVKE